MLFHCFFDSINILGGSISSYRNFWLEVSWLIIVPQKVEADLIYVCNSKKMINTFILFIFLWQFSYFFYYYDILSIAISIQYRNSYNDNDRCDSRKRPYIEIQVCHLFESRTIHRRMWISSCDRFKPIWIFGEGFAHYTPLQKCNGLKGRHSNTTDVRQLWAHRAVCFCVCREWSVQSIFVSPDEPSSNSCLFAWICVNGGIHVEYMSLAACRLSWIVQREILHTLIPFFRTRPTWISLEIFSSSFCWLRFYDRSIPVIMMLSCNANEYDFLFICASELIPILGLEQLT